MAGINWKLFFTAALLAVGIYLLVAHRDCPKLSNQERHKYRTRRQIGWVLVAGSIALGVYFYYTGAIKFSAQMPNDCNTCKLYVQRHRGLRPYSTEEFKMLRSHADACKTCSNMCFDEIQLLERYPPVDNRELARKKEACADTTKHAIFALNELGRMEKRLSQHRTRYWQAAHDAGGEPAWDPFPDVPTQNLELEDEPKILSCCNINGL